MIDCDLLAGTLGHDHAAWLEKYCTRLPLLSVPGRPCCEMVHGVDDVGAVKKCCVSETLPHESARLLHTTYVHDIADDG